MLRANLIFRAVPVPAGRHVVELRYRPQSVVLGLLVSSAAAALSLGLTFLRRAPTGASAADRASPRASGS